MRSTGKAKLMNTKSETVVFLATIEREKRMEADVPSYPVEKGYEVSDTIIKKPLTITFKGRIDDNKELIKLEQMYTRGDIVDYITPARWNTNFAIASLSIAESAEVGNAYVVTVTLKAIETTKAKVVDVAIDESAQSGVTDVPSEAVTEEVEVIDPAELLREAIEAGGTPVTAEEAIAQGYISREELAYGNQPTYKFRKSVIGVFERIFNYLSGGIN